MSSAPSAQAEASRWVRHATARLSPQQPETPANPDWAGSEQDYDRATVDELQAKWGVEGQPFPWSIASCRSDGNQVRAEVTLADAEASGLPVAMLDAAVQIARLADITDERLLVPAGVQSMSMTGELTGTDLSVTVLRRPDAGDDLLIDVAVTDGSARLDIRGLRYVDVQAGAAQSAAPVADPRDVAHALDWQPWSAPERTERGAGLSVAVLGAQREELTRALTAAGHQVVDEGDASSVIFVPATDTDEDDLACAARLTAEVADIVRRLAAREGREEPRLWIVTRGVRETGSRDAVRQSCLWGVAGVIGAEQPQLWGGLVDLAEDGQTGAADMLAELLSTPAKTILSLRDGQLSEQVLAPLADDAAREPYREPLRCRADAAYLITGGMGALGLLTAGWLADRGARRVVLAGRTPLPPRRDWDADSLDETTRHKIEAVRELEARGVAVEIAVLDIGSASALETFLMQRDDAGAPPVRGVVHAAGVTDSQLLTDLSADRVQSTLWPKVAGAAALDAVFPPGSLDFLHFTASAGTVFGVPGQGAYAAGNAYLDGLARARHAQGDATVSLDWVAWRGLGFGSDAQVVVDELERRGSRPVTPAEAFDAWEYVSRFDIAHAVMAPIVPENDPDTASGGTGVAPARAWSEMSADEVLAELQNGLRTILATELRTPESEVDTDRPFAEMGLNSVMAMSIRREVEQLTRVELSATMLWNHPTIASLATHLAEKVAPHTVSQADSDVDSASDSLLDSLFDSVESSSASSEGRI